MYSIVLMMAMTGPAMEAPSFGRHGCTGAASCHGGFLGLGSMRTGCHGGNFLGLGGHSCHGGNFLGLGGHSCHGYVSHSCHGGNGCHGGFLGHGMRNGCHGGTSCCGTVSAGCAGSAPATAAPGTPPAKMPEPPKK